MYKQTCDMATADAFLNTLERFVNPTWKTKTLALLADMKKGREIPNEHEAIGFFKFLLTDAFGSFGGFSVRDGHELSLQPLQYMRKYRDDVEGVFATLSSMTHNGKPITKIGEWDLCTLQACLDDLIEAAEDLLKAQELKAQEEADEAQAAVLQVEEMKAAEQEEADARMAQMMAEQEEAGVGGMY